jgi:hypothetical protein
LNPADISPTGCRFQNCRRKGAQRMAEVIATVFAVIVFLLFCVLIATGLTWGILIIVKEAIELWREIKE